MLDRIRTLLTARQLSPTQFADVIGVSRPIISHILSGRNKPSLEVVQKIVGAFPDLSLRWLLNGEGAMVVSDGPQKPIEPARTLQKAVKDTQPTPEPQPASTQPEAAVTASVAAPVAAETTPAYQPAPVTPAASSNTASTSAVDAVGTISTANVPLVDNQVVAEQTIPGAIATYPAGVGLITPVGAPLAAADKQIRRIVIFYQDGTFSDYQPETPA